MLLKADNVCKSYNNAGIKLDVLNGVNLSMEQAEVNLIIGPSGAGKSTLLHILGGLDRPSLGNVFFDGIDMYGASDNTRSSIRNKRMGFVFQFYHLLNEFSAIENVMMPMFIQGYNSNLKKQAKLRAELLLDSVGISHRAGHRPTQLSGGEAQRVALARALINNPDIVLCDEPTGNLDSENANTVLNLVRHLNEKFRQAFLIVTHNEALANFADHVIYIEDGKIK
jgi:lipoprotein-releasing system ATP-binding protein